LKRECAKTRSIVPMIQSTKEAAPPGPRTDKNLCAGSLRYLGALLGKVEAFWGMQPLLNRLGG